MKRWRAAEELRAMAAGMNEAEVRELKHTIDESWYTRREWHELDESLEMRAFLI